MGDFLGPLNQICSRVMGYFFRPLNQFFSRVMGYFFGPLNQFFLRKMAPIFLEALDEPLRCRRRFFFQKNCPHISGSPGWPPMLPQALFFSQKNGPLILGVTHKWIWIWIYPVCDDMGYPVNKGEGYLRIHLVAPPSLAAASQEKVKSKGETMKHIRTKIHLHAKLSATS